MEGRERDMDEQTKTLLIEIAGFLTCVREGILPAAHVQKEANELLDKIGERLTAPSGRGGKAGE